MSVAVPTAQLATQHARTEKEASATPPTMGASVASMAALGTEPMKAQDSSTEKNGSMACGCSGARFSAGNSRECAANEAHAP